jgi:hypothetical protein
MNFADITAHTRGRRRAVEKLIIILVAYFVLVQFVFPRLGLKPG